MEEHILRTYAKYYCHIEHIQHIQSKSQVRKRIQNDISIRKFAKYIKDKIYMTQVKL